MPTRLLVEEVLDVARPIALALVNEGKPPPNLKALRCDRVRPFRDLKNLAGKGSPRDPLASPLHADLAGLPPLLIHVGDCETLLDDSTRFAEKARAAGVDVTLEVWDGMIHVFQLFAAELPEARRAIDGIGVFLRKHLG